MVFPISDELYLKPDEREELYERIIEKGFSMEMRERYDPEENDWYTDQFITIDSLEDLLKLKEITGSQVVIHDIGLILTAK